MIMQCFDGTKSTREAGEALEEAMSTADQGKQALFLHHHQGFGPGPFAKPGVIGKLMDMDVKRLTETARGLGVRHVKIDRLGRRGQHIDLVGMPLQKARNACLPSEQQIMLPLKMQNSMHK